MSGTDNKQEPSDTPQKEQVIPQAEQEDVPIPVTTQSKTKVPKEPKLTRPKK